MKRIKRIKQVIIVVLLLFVIVLSGLYTHIKFLNEEINASEIVETSSIAKKRSLINKMIQKKGGLQTFNTLKDLYKGNYDGGHNTLHIYGEELFKVVGDSGVAVCDASFGFGCYHGFSTQALINRGPEALAMLGKACKKSGDLHLACEHGLGHGALEYFGEKNIVEALDACRTLPWKGKLYGCQDGVFMQYNFPDNLEEVEGKDKTRKLDPQNPYDPCETLPQNYRNACFYSLGQWWSFETSNKYSQMGEFCLNLSNKYYRNSCFIGIGNDALADGNFEPERIVNICKSLGSYEGEMTCRTAAYFGLLGKEEYKENAYLVCEGLTPNDKNKCLDYSIIQELKVDEI